MASSSSSSTQEYDVFLSFRGTDTRHHFISHLYHALNSKGVYTFKDDKELHPGEEIDTLFEALKQSKISIPVFSKAYATSKWCLEEVAKMLQCKEMKGQIIMPIFFYVDPRDVRNQTGSFGKAFNKHGPAISHEWREALKKVGKLIGWVHNKHKKWDESELVESIVDEVLIKLDRTPLHVAKHPIGLESRVEDLLSLLSLESMDTRFVGICGMGGIGKTTMAKAVYNRIFQTFNGGSSFLAQVKEKKPVDLQNQLLKNIIREENLIDDVDKGKGLIKQRLQRKTVLLILDDVDHHKQIETLAGDLSWFGPRSRIIITTRDERVLKVGQVEIYRLDEWDKEQSLQLFSWHAFHQNQPPKKFIDLSRDVVSYAGGLPLTLEVLGSFLGTSKDVTLWKSKLQSLKEIPPGEVQKTLKISFDGLNVQEQAIFLDTACFFVGESKERTVDMWKACGFNPDIALDVLIQKFLLRIDEYNLLWMHDQLQEMGRAIVNEESEPGNRTRLWNAEEIIDVLERHKGTQIEVIQFNSPKHEEDNINIEDIEEEDAISLEAFATMSKLRILMIEDRKIMGNIDHLPSELKWLELVDIDLSDNTWNNGHKKKKFRKLKGLHLRFNEFVSLDVSRFPQLEHLILFPCSELDDVEPITQLKKLVRLELHGCHKLKELHPSICSLQLERLSLTDCCSLTGIPDSIGEMTSLVYLNLHSTCYKLKKLHPSICRLRFLKVLKLGCAGLEKLPKSINKLRKLERLSLNGCCSLTGIPDSIGGMKSLVEIHLNETLIKRIPNDIGLLEKLKELYVSDCEFLKCIPKLPSSLIIFNARGSNSVTRVEDQSSMRNLQELHLSFPENKTRWSSSGYLDYIGKMESLVKLFMGNSLIKEIPEAIGQLKKLEMLGVNDCPYLESILIKLPSSLISLNASECKSLERLSDLSHLKNLVELSLFSCMKLGEIQGLEGAESLVYLDVSGCNTLTDRMITVLVQDSCNIRLSRFREYRQRFVVSENEINDGKNLYLAFKFRSAEEVRVANGRLEIIAEIHRNGRKITCLSEFPINDHHKIHGEKMCILCFKGPNWFVLPLKGKDEIKIEVTTLVGDHPLEAKCYISFGDSSCIDDLRSYSLREHEKEERKNKRTRDRLRLTRCGKRRASHIHRHMAMVFFNKPIRILNFHHLFLGRRAHFAYRRSRLLPSRATFNWPPENSRNAGH